MIIFKNKIKYYLQSLLIIPTALSFLSSCKATSTGLTTTTTNTVPTTTTTTVTPSPQIEERDTLSGASIELSDGAFILSNNDWGYSCNSSECDQVIILYTDDSYGWEWRRDTTNDTDPNYPEVICGTKPWGTQTDDSIFPIQIKDLNSCGSEMDIEYSVTGDNWNFALEFWLTEQKPEGNDVSSSITDEVMIWLGWGATHDGVGIVEQDVITDGVNIYDYAQYSIYDNWDYHQFRISGEQRIPSTIDLKPFVDYIKDRYNLSDTLWVSGVELGNEYWDYTEGACTVKSLSYTVNGESVISGSE
jgi:chitinase